MYYVPATEDMRKQTGVPFGIVLSPLAKVAKDEIEPPVTDFGPSGILAKNIREINTSQIFFYVKSILFLFFRTCSLHEMQSLHVFFDAIY